MSMHQQNILFSQINQASAWIMPVGKLSNNYITDIIYSDKTVEDKKIEINQVIYPQVTDLLNSTDEDAWGNFRNVYRSCVSVG